MNDIDEMPSKCQNCPYWELAKEPYCCGECAEKQLESYSKVLQSDVFNAVSEF